MNTSTGLPAFTSTCVSLVLYGFVTCVRSVYLPPRSRYRTFRRYQDPAMLPFYNYTHVPPVPHPFPNLWQPLSGTDLPWKISSIFCIGCSI